MLNLKPRGSLCWVICYSGPQTPSGFPRAPSAGCGFPSSQTASDLQLYCNSNSSGPKLPLRPDVAFPTTSLSNWLKLHSDSNSTELYNGSTPTRSLKSHVWSSSSGNNCHAVQRSLSSGASVYESIMRFFFTSSHFISQFPPTRFPLLLPLECVTSFRCITLNGILLGSKVKI